MIFWFSFVVFSFFNGDNLLHFKIVIRARETLYALRSVSETGASPSGAFETSALLVSLMMAPSRFSRKIVEHVSILQVIDAVMSLGSCPRVVYQAPQYFIYSNKGTTSWNYPTTEMCWGCGVEGGGVERAYKAIKWN